jgi:type I restriction enzyme S subunit
MSEMKKLKEIISFKGGGTPSKSVADYWDGDIPWATVKDFTSTSISITQDFITNEGLKNSAANLIPKGHIIIPTRMSLGKAAINTIELAINQDLRALIPKVELDTKYLLYAVLSLKDQILKKGSGATVKGITQEALYDLEIYFPPFDDQKRIAYLLSKVEGLIAQRKQHLQQLDDLLKSVFLEMFGDPVRNEKGWETKTLGNLASSFKYGTNVKSNDDASNGFPVLRIPNVVGGKIDLKNMKYSRLDKAELEKTKLIAGDLLLVRTNGNPEYIGRSAVFDISESIYAYASYLIRVRLSGSDTIRPDFLNFVINFPSYRSSLVARAKTTAGNYNINTASLKTLIIPKPPIELQNKFAAIVEKVEGIKTRYQASLADLENLYGALSQKAFKGELDLSRVPLPPTSPTPP